MATHPVTEFISPSAWALVEDKFSPFAKETLAKLVDFVQTEVVPAQKTYHEVIPTDPSKRWTTTNPVIKDLKSKARKLGLWNLFLSKAHYEFGVPLTNLEVGLSSPCQCRTF
jgi:acyl-CoA dehydrogenase